jgi:hypothetical protein
VWGEDRCGEKTGVIAPMADVHCFVVFRLPGCQSGRTRAPWPAQELLPLRGGAHEAAAGSRQGFADENEPKRGGAFSAVPMALRPHKRANRTIVP